MVLKFGQPWRYTNVTHIVPGFASMYRTSALEYITMNPPGLVIEDFNMTFEIHHKRLGIVAHDPRVVGFTQDPDNLRDYYRQIKRWHLGFWQTVRFHGLWPGKFWASLSLTLVEAVTSGLFFLGLPLLVLVWFVPGIPGFVTVSIWLHAHLIAGWLWWGVFVPDYALTIIAAIAQKRPHYLMVGIAFPFIRFFD